MATTPPFNPAQQAQQATGAPDASRLPDILQKKVWSLLIELETADEIPRRLEVRKILQRRLVFRGDHYWFWNEDMGTWLPPNQAPLGLNENYERPGFQHVTNIFQAYALSLCSVISQNNTAARFWPEKPSNPKDVQFAKNGSKAVDLIHRQNDWQNLIDEATYYMCTDGLVGSYSRYVSDGEKFGHDERDILAAVEVEVGGPSVQCADCGYSDEGTTEQGPTCPECGQPLQDVPPEKALAPKYVGTLKLPKGQEVISMVPALQLKRTMYADHQSDFLYLDWITDLDRAVAMATYPEIADKLDTSSGGEADGSATSTYEKIARRILYLGTGRHAGQVLKDLGTFRRAWIRPKAFYRLPGHVENEPVPCDRCQLLQLYPEGCHVVFFNDVYCESRNESMDKKWETMHTMPGEGQVRETLVSSIMPVQEQLNDAVNLLFETCMYGVPEGFADTDLLDFEARQGTSAQVGNLTPVKLEPNANIDQKMKFLPAAEPSMALMKYIDMLFASIPQFLTGAFPALFGGDTGQNDTARGIAIQRNQAMGRIGRAWRRLQLFLANTDAKAVKCFAENRTEDVEIPKMGASGNYESDTLRLEDFQGNITAYPEVDAQYPTLEADVRALILNLWNGTNPLFLATAQVPENLEYIFRIMGCTDLQIPGEQQRKKTYRDIERLAQEQPQPGMPIPEQPPSPQNPQGVPAQDGPPVPSVQPDPDVDDLKVAGDTAKSWLISDEGMEQQGTPGYENVKLYAKACEQLAKLQTLKNALATQSLAGNGPAADLGGAEDVHPPQPPNAGAPGSSPSTDAAPEGA